VNEKQLKENTEAIEKIREILTDHEYDIRDKAESGDIEHFDASEIEYDIDSLEVNVDQVFRRTTSLLEESEEFKEDLKETLSIADQACDDAEQNRKVIFYLSEKVEELSKKVKELEERTQTTPLTLVKSN